LKIQRTWWLIAAGLVAAAAFLGGVLAPPTAGARVYQGKPLRIWCQQALSNDPRLSSEATNVLAQAGVAVIPHLSALLESGDPFYRTWAWRHSEWLPRAARTEILRRVKYPDSDTIRMGAARALGLFGPAAQGEIPSLSRAMQEGRPPYLWECGIALSKVGAPAVPALTNALAHTNSVVRQAAAANLERIGVSGSNSIPSLLRQLDDPTDYVREAVVRALAAMTPVSVPGLLQWISHGSRVERMGAARALALAHVSWRLAGSPLLAMANDPDPEVRTQALESLGDVGASDSATIARLIQALGETNGVARGTAAEALGKMQSRAAAAAPRLTELLTDSSEDVREVAARSLGKIGPAAKVAIPGLVRLLQDPSPGVRMAATTALAQLQGQ